MSNDEDLPTRLRHEAEILPHETYSWLNPVLTKAAAEIERLYAVLKDTSAKLHRWETWDEPSGMLLGDLADDIDVALKPSNDA